MLFSLILFFCRCIKYEMQGDQVEEGEIERGFVDDN